MTLSGSRIILMYIFICFGIFSLSDCHRNDSKSSNIVAKIEHNYIITYSDLRKFVFERLYHRMYKDEYQAYHQALKVMVTNQLKCIDFFEKGLDKNKELMQEDIQRQISEELVVIYFNTQFLDKYTSDEFARKIYDNVGKQVVYQQIVLYKPRDASKIQLDSLMNSALTIKADIDNGIDFKKLVDKYSQDVESSDSDGYMPPVGWEESLSNPGDNIIFNLNIGDVQVLNTYNAYRIVKITDIKKQEVKPFIEIKDEIIAKLKKGYLDTSLKEYDEAKDKLLDPNEIKWNNQTLDILLNWTKIPNFYINIYKDTLKNAISTGRNFTILTYLQDKVDFREYLRLLENVLIPIDTREMKKNDMKNFIVEAIRTDKIVEKAKNLDLEKDILDPEKISPVLKSKIVKLYNQTVIESNIPDANDENINKFYEEQKDTLYYNLKKINIYVMPYAEEQKAQEVIDKINNGTPFEKISGRWLVKTYVRDRDGTIKSYRSSEKAIFGKIAFKLDLNETTGPIKYDDPEKGKQFAVIKCIHIRPEGQLQFEDVTNTIKDDFINYYRNKIEKEVEQQLWGEYDAIIYDDVLKTKLSSINQNE